jgi:phasin family protein
MYVTPDQITTYGKAGVETLFTLARSNFAAYEKLAALNFNATKEGFEDALNHARALLNARDVQAYVNLNVAAAQPRLEKLITYSRSVYELSASHQAEFTRLVEGQAAEINKTFAGLLEKIGRNAPAGSDVAIAAVKSMLGAATSAYDSFSKATKQATEIAEANIAAATAAVTNIKKAA